MTTVPMKNGSPEGTPGARYPAELVCDVTTPEGTTIHLRTIRPDDAPGLVRFHQGLSPQSIYRRFFSVHPKLSDAEVAWFTCVDYVNRLALVAEDGGRLVAIGRYDKSPGSREAEVAFVVLDEYQHHGIGTLLLERLADAAWRNGVTTFVASTLADNRAMQHVFATSGFKVTRVLDGGIVSFRFSIEPDDDYRAARAARAARHASHQDDPPGPEAPPC